MLRCITPACRRPAKPSSTTGMCGACQAYWLKTAIPVAGFFPSADLVEIGKVFLAEVSPSASEITSALRIVRGTRHPTGDWSDRPAYRLQPLLHGRWNVRLPHLLVGRRRTPNLTSLGAALVHYHLAIAIMGVRPRYAAYLAGGTWMARRGVSAPKGSDILTGGAGHTGYTIHATDFGTIGRTVLKAGEQLGVRSKSREVTDRITELYLAGLSRGAYRPSVVVPQGTRRTPAMGDHPFDHNLPPFPSVPREYWGCIRRASGRIAGEWPIGLDLSWEEVEAQRSAQRISQRHPAQFTVATTPPPSTDWIFRR